jgi:hypothetical protein
MTWYGWKPDDLCRGRIMRLTGLCSTAQAHLHFDSDFNSFTARPFL